MREFEPFFPTRERVLLPIVPSDCQTIDEERGAIKETLMKLFKIKIDLAKGEIANCPNTFVECMNNRECPLNGHPAQQCVNGTDVDNNIAVLQKQFRRFSKAYAKKEN